MLILWPCGGGVVAITFVYQSVTTPPHSLQFVLVTDPFVVPH